VLLNALGRGVDAERGRQRRVGTVQVDPARVDQLLVGQAAECGDEEGEGGGGSVVGRAMASSLGVSLSALAASTSGGAGCEAALAERMAGASEAAGAELGGGVKTAALRQAGFSLHLSAFERTSSANTGQTARQAAAYARQGRENAGLWLAALRYFYGLQPRKCLFQKFSCLQ
jgi:hypothetical protein